MSHQKLTAISSFILLGVTLLLSSCVGSQSKAVSEKGREACMEEVASSSFATQQKKQQTFRECLRTIDDRLEQLRKQVSAQQATQQEEEARKSRERSASWASPTDRLNHCRMVQEEVILLDKDRIRAYARLIGSSSSNASAAEVDQYQRDYDTIIRRFDQLIPSAMRASWQLVPEAIEHFKRCDSNDFAITS